ncbi:MAG: hypothetical protein KGO96_14040 [Elusimicrobia bacterium]|nr:hypothetical protein [Elusimicrobiota bacterium]
MKKTKSPDQYHPDKAVIDALGGSTELARKLGLDPTAGGVQRVENWKSRGIPAAIRLEHFQLFSAAAAAAASELQQGEAA